jgi:hypothetical protein
MKSPLSMNFGRISTSKCRGKWGAIHPTPLKKPRPLLHARDFILFLKRTAKKTKNKTPLLSV